MMTSEICLEEGANNEHTWYVLLNILNIIKLEVCGHYVARKYDACKLIVP